MALDLSKIVQEGFPAKEYIEEAVDKKQIVLHHTVSGEGVTGDIKHWLNDPKRIATCIIIAHDGTIHQCFSSKYWGYHLGIPKETFPKYKLKFKNLDKISIGIEIDSYGGLKKHEGKWYNSYDFKANKFTNPIPEEKIVEYAQGYRGYYAFERYTKKQIQAVEDLILYWHKQYNIRVDFNEEMFDVSARALSGESGIWSHTSYRSDKSDIHPQEDLIEMLKGLKKKSSNLEEKMNDEVLNEKEETSTESEIKNTNKTTDINTATEQTTTKKVDVKEYKVKDAGSRLNKVSETKRKK